MTFSHDEDFLWTGTKEGSMVAIRYRPPNVSPKGILSTHHDPGGKKVGESDSSKDKRRQLIAMIAAAVKQSDEVLSDEGGWPASYYGHSLGASCENKDDEELGGCPKSIPLEEAMRKCRPMSVPQIVAIVNETATNEDDDSKLIRWKRVPSGVAKMQKEYEAIAQVLYWAGTRR